MNLDSHSASTEIVESKTILEDFFGQKVDVFCYPWGQYNENTLELVQESHNMAVTTHGRKMSRNNNNNYIYQLPRIPGHSRRYLLKWKLSDTSTWWDRVRQLLEVP